MSQNTKTEDDTFDALRRSPFTVVLDSVTSLDLRKGSTEVYNETLSKHNWTFKEFMHACRQYANGIK